ncbi:MAG: cytochrome c biogenesis protein ResB, partial [Maribacter sp.]|nr:cytochrome c biogenesis protein ResB [Maribacter sp.]
MLSWKKISGFVFHIAFAIIIIGAAVTRYFGYEGRMHIREGASSNFIYSSDDYLIVKGNDGTADFIKHMPLMMGQNMDNSFKTVVKAASKGAIDIIYRDHIINATETFEETGEGDIDLLYLTLSVQGHKDEIVIRKGELKMNHDFPVAYNNNSNPNALQITGAGDSLVIRYPHQIQVKAMPSMAESVIPAAQNGSFERMHLYEPEGSGVALVLTNHVQNATVKYVAGPEEQNTPDALVLDVTFNGLTKEATVLGGSGYLENFHKVSFDDLDLEISYGAKRIDLPFSVKLNDFQLERYDGSMSPSSYASVVTLIDEANDVNFDHRIFMNNVLDYGGYRFFQSSYDQDERGTILSVNHDWWGTIITYLGYALMIIGFVWTLFNPHSRYWDLMKKIRHLRERRKALSVILIAFATSLISAQQSPQNHTHQENPYAVSREHADKFAEMMVLTYEGRYSPINTLAIDVMHKISRKDIITIPARGEMTANQMFLDIPLNVEFWKNQKIIYIREEAVSDLLGITETYASFNTFFNQKGEYLLGAYAEEASRKPEAERNTLDKEVIKINERLEIFMMTYQGSLLDIFPVQDSPDKWISWEDKLATTELQGSIRIINDDLQLPQVNYQQIMRLYFKETY